MLRDVDVAPLAAYQRASSPALWSSPVLLSVAHGEAMSPELEEGFYEAISTYSGRATRDAFAEELEYAVNRDTIPQR